MSLWLLDLSSIGTLCVQVWLYGCYAKAKGLKSPARLRLTFLGMSAASFAYAVFDVRSFYFGGGVDVGAFFISLALGSILILAERFIDVYQHHELWLG